MGSTTECEGGRGCRGVSVTSVLTGDETHRLAGRLRFEVRGGGGGGGGDGGGGGIIITRTRNVDESWKTASIDVPHNVQPLHAPNWNEAASLGVSQLVVPMLLIASAALFL